MDWRQEWRRQCAEASKGCKSCHGKGYVESVMHVTPCHACIPGWPNPQVPQPAPEGE